MIELFPLKPKIWSILLYNQPFSRYNMLSNIGKIRNALNDLRVTLNTGQYPVYIKYFPQKPKF